MRFGGHETFTIREGWLHKGLMLLKNHPDRLVDEYSADWLGVGKNMAKSIRHWLLASGIAGKSNSGRSVRLEETELGNLLSEEDPYFGELGTLWTIHINLVRSENDAYSWFWFFNHFNMNRFERSVCVEGLLRHLQHSSGRMPSPRTLDRDISCMLSTYAKKIPLEHEDPEDSPDCPFTELGLFSYFKTSGYYQVHQGLKNVPAHIFCYAMSLAFPESQDGNGTIEIPIQHATRYPGSPGRAFILTSESLFELALKVENEIPQDVQIAGLAGNRVIRMTRKKPLEWLSDYYSELKRRTHHAA